MAKTPSSAEDKKRGRGRPSIKSPEILKAILDRLALGESLRSICRDEGMPDERTVRDWAMNDEDFSPQYAIARDAGLDRMAEEILEIADDATNDWMDRHGEDNQGYQLNGEHIQRSRLRVDSRKWYLSKLAPKRYGDRTVLAGDPDSPLIPSKIEIVLVDGE